MSILSDQEIKNCCGRMREFSDAGRPLSHPFWEEWKEGMIKPFVEKQMSEGIISFGLSSYGYDIRVADDFRIFNNLGSKWVDPKHFDPNLLWTLKGTEHLDTDDGKSYFAVIPPNSFALAKTVEYFRIPRDIMTICVGKSTYARCGIIVNVTPFEPEWEGYATMEISNTTPCPAKIYANEGIAQVLFFKADKTCYTSYADRKGKYQKQTELTLPKVK